MHTNNTSATHMITAATIKALSSFTTADLTRMIQSAGHRKHAFLYSEFLGISNSGQGVYGVCSVVNGQAETAKVFVQLSAELATPTASY